MPKTDDGEPMKKVRARRGSEPFEINPKGDYSLLDNLTSGRDEKGDAVDYQKPVKKDE
ncbi:hypothetical protein LCGC14_2399120 [marine sediment metagenome]|uniref:Uncharacterized protein n=1 Tax=marine sediment metagenome TaxID=412755 RepID=A0A0F9EQA1_9ZZZZ